jgi:hypothetical protein
MGAFILRGQPRRRRDSWLVNSAEMAKVIRAANIRVE